MLHRARVLLTIPVLGLVLLGSADPSWADQRAWTREVILLPEGDPIDPHAAAPRGREPDVAQADGAGSHRGPLPWKWTASLIRGLAVLFR